MDRSSRAQSVSFGYSGISRFLCVLQDELIYGGHLTALGAPVKVIAVAILLDIRVGLPLLFIAYIATLSVYSVDYHRSIEKDTTTNPGRTSYLSRMASAFPYRIGLYMALLLASLALFANSGLILLIVCLTLLGIMYSVIFKSFTKKIPGFKNIFTSGVWSSGVVLGLMLFYSLPFDLFFIFMLLFLFMRSLGNVIFFDLKDVEPDAAEGLKTVPALLGVKPTILLLQAMNIASFLPLVAGILLGEIPAYAISMVALAFFTSRNLRLANTAEIKQLGYTYFMMADAETMLWPVLLLSSKAVNYILG